MPPREPRDGEGLTRGDFTTAFAPDESTPAPAPTVRVALVAGGPPTVRTLAPGDALTVGRSRRCDLRIPDQTVSREHAILRLDDAGALTVEDLGTRNGVSLGGRKIVGRVALPLGETLRVGSAELVATGERVDATSDHHGVEAERPMERARHLADRAATRDVTVLILGETGSGKEVMARRIHDASARASKPFVAVNCGALVATLAESQLFGHERGAFTGADRLHRGAFEQANGGTLFLDEVGELSANAQTLLLRVLETREVVRVGGVESVPVDVRVLAATHRDLDAACREGRFREDLRYRLDVLRVVVPPLRERRDEILPLARRFLAEFGAPEGALGAAAARALSAYDFPGNVRELRNAMERASALVEDDGISVEMLGLSRATVPRAAGELRASTEAQERATIRAALEAEGGNQTRAAKRLGIARRTLISKMEKHGLKPPPKPRR